MKVCACCKNSLELSRFCHRTASNDGLSPICRMCASIKKRAHYAANRERLKAYSRNWYKKNTARARDTSERWKRANAERCRETKWRWHVAHKDVTTARQQKQYQANRQSVIERVAQYTRTADGRRVATKATLRYRQRHRDKYLAQKRAQRAIKNGKLVPRPCERCGADKVQAHHADYSWPLDVTWLCVGCHLAEHGKRILRGPRDGSPIVRSTSG